ncbi:MAG: outer membrane protein assembly factor BamA [Proteobacteria bacterium]|nr:outer membrane protein assembly factor BamA [Pseudomonadota bacterium]
MRFAWLLCAVLMLVGGALMPAAPTFAQIAAAGRIGEIVVEGAQRIDAATVRSYLLIQEGEPFDPDRLDRSLKSLFATGLFADVTFRREGQTLVVNVVENPIINRIAFEGNRRLDDDALNAEVTLKPRVIYTRTKVQSDVNRILTLYRRSGRFSATVELKVIQLPQNRVDLAFEINEGPVTRVENIRFIGNQTYSDGKLREAIRTKESRWYRFLSSDDTYDPDRLTLDRELLRRFYLRQGYADFRVVSAVAELTPDQSAFYITITVDEGNPYTYGDINVAAKLRDLKPDQLQDKVELEAGERYDADAVEKTVDRLTDAVGELGYAFVEVRPRIERDRENRKINIAFEVEEGPRVFVERIDILGNVRTIDNVVRREFRVVEGDAFNSAKLRRSRQRLQNLDFFKTVNVERVPGSAPDKTIITVDVEEKSTGALTFGVGYSTNVGGLLEVGLRERNVLGRGYDVRLNGRLSVRRSQVDLSLTDPYFLDREIAAGIDLFRTENDLQQGKFYDQLKLYDMVQYGMALRAAYPITEDLRQDWRYMISQTEIQNVTARASTLIREQEGKSLLSQVTHSLIYDQRDSKIQPREGYFVRVTNDVAGLGGDVHLLRNRLDGGQYFPFEGDYVLALTGRVGYVLGLGEDVPFIQRFNLGGDNLRGFETNGAGPRDISTSDALGGEWMYDGTAQVSFPIGLPNELGLRAHVFTDVGSTGGVSPTRPYVRDTGTPRVSAGVGLEWATAFGLIVIDLALPVIKEDFDKTEIFRLNFGTRF